MALLSQLSSLVQSRGGIKAKQWGKVTALLAKDTTKVCGWRCAVGKQEVRQLEQKGGVHITYIMKHSRQSCLAAAA